MRLWGVKESRFIAIIVGLWLAGSALGGAQSASEQREFPQSPAQVEKVIRTLKSSAAGRLPALDGFAQAGVHPLDRYQRGYYQCETQVAAGTTGGSVVKVTAKITAWYSDPVAAQSGYQVLPSNGRLETDFLDRLQDALQGNVASSPGVAPVAPQKPTPPPKTAVSKPIPEPALSAPVPNQSVIADAISASRTPVKSAANNSRIPEPSGDAATQKAVVDRHNAELEKEAQGLEEILRNQAKPNNLAAVKKSGTPILTSPNEAAKQLFVAQAEDEFEILDMNASWVHVRISGLSRGWIRRSAVELESDAATNVQVAKGQDAPAPASGKDASQKKTVGPAFQIENEQIASFPGTWQPLRGKTVEIVSVQKAGAVGGDAEAKLAYAKSIFDRKYIELSKESSSAAGVVVIFDSEDGGMMATTMDVLKTWKSGDLTDEALWRHCYFDPIEAFTPAGQ